MSGREAKHAIGLMSGTSMDGIDVALVRTDGDTLIERGPSREYAYTLAQRDLLEGAVADARGEQDANTLRARYADLERTLTDWHGDAVERFERETGAAGELVGFHGHTLAHRPQGGWTLQLGCGAQLAERLKRTVVSDFRTADMHNGGQGAPLVPVYHAALAAETGEHRSVAFLNVGGIANVTIVRPDEPPIAFDCGPGNVLVDRWIQRGVGVPYDAGGRIASEGRIVSAWLEQQGARTNGEVVRSLDRFDFPLPPSGTFELADGARTLVRYTAQEAARALRPYDPSLVVVCGGGRLNDVLLADLRELIDGRVEVAEAFGFDGGAMEAEAFAYLGVRTLAGLPTSFPTTTGCRTPTGGARVDQP